MSHNLFYSENKCSYHLRSKNSYFAFIICLCCIKKGIYFAFKIKLWLILPMIYSSHSMLQPIYTLANIKDQLVLCMQ